MKIELLHKNLKFLRKSNGLTLDQMLEKCGIKGTTWANYEAGTSKPRIEDLMNISKIFEVTETDLLRYNLALGPRPVAGSTQETVAVMQDLITCMKEKEALIKENAELKSAAAPSLLQSQLKKA